jgi:hypothetical protein
VQHVIVRVVWHINFVPVNIYIVIQCLENIVKYGESEVGFRLVYLLEVRLLSSTYYRILREICFTGLGVLVHNVTPRLMSI